MAPPPGPLLVTQEVLANMSTLRSSGFRWVTWVGAALLGVATSGEATDPTGRAVAAPGARSAQRPRAQGLAPESPVSPSSRGVPGVSRPAPAPATTPIGYEHRAGEALVMSAPGRLDAVVADAGRALGGGAGRQAASPTESVRTA